MDGGCASSPPSAAPPAHARLAGPSLLGGRLLQRGRQARNDAVLTCGRRGASATRLLRTLGSSSSLWNGFKPDDLYPAKGVRDGTLSAVTCYLSRKQMPFPAFYLEETMKISTIALAAVFALSSSSIALAKHRHHHHHMHGMTTGMGSSTGPSGPRMDGGGVDKSRPGGQGVSRKPAE